MLDKWCGCGKTSMAIPYLHICPSMTPWCRAYQCQWYLAMLHQMPGRDQPQKSNFYIPQKQKSRSTKIFDQNIKAEMYFPENYHAYCLQPQHHHVVLYLTKGWILYCDLISATARQALPSAVVQPKAIYLHMDNVNQSWVAGCSHPADLIPHWRIWFILHSTHCMVACQVLKVSGDIGYSKASAT